MRESSYTYDRDKIYMDDDYDDDGHVVYVGDDDLDGEEDDVTQMRVYRAFLLGLICGVGVGIVLAIIWTVIASSWRAT